MGRSDARREGLAELLIESIGARGDGLAQLRGELVFVPFTMPGDRVRARLGAQRHGGREGLVVDRLASKPGAAAPFPPRGVSTGEPIGRDDTRWGGFSGVGPDRPMLDLFAGLGTFAFALAHGGPVHAIEGDARNADALAQAAAE